MEEVKAVWHENFRPRHSEVDADGYVKLKALLDYLQEAAANHADNLGCGMRFLLGNKKMWVLSRIKLRFAEKLKLGVEYTVKTYPMNFKKLFAAREFVIYDSRSIPLVCGSSFWLLLAADTLRPLKPAENLPDFPDNSALVEFYRKIDKINLNPAVTPENCVFSTTVRDSQIDLNRHLNNAEYASMIHDAMAGIIKHTPHFAELQINFLAASKSGERLSIAALLDQRHFEVAGFGNGQTKFHAAGILAE